MWGEFDIHAIEAEEVSANTVNVVPSDNSVTIIWTVVDGADTYEITISDGEGRSICQLIFNSNGQLQNIVFNAPARNNVQQHTQSAGFRFEVTGLDPGTTYNYAIVAKDAAQEVLDNQTGSFTTTSQTAVEQASVNATAKQKLIQDGQLIFVLPDGSRYSATGMKME